jgi:hypothetical protein
MSERPDIVLVHGARMGEPAWNRSDCHRPCPL